MTVEHSHPEPMCEPTPEGGLRVRAPAKLNLALSVGAPRPDGFHEIDSVIVKVTLYDELALRPRDDGEIRLECGPLDCGPVEDNLVYRAALLLGGGSGHGADITLTKRIAPGAGLGGGSSDAAAALVALARLWGLDLPAGRLRELAEQLGSDVPALLGGPAARVRGRGERVEPVEVHPFTAVLCVPDVHCPTAEVYAAHDRLTGQAGRAQRIDPELLRRPPSQWRSRVGNDLAAAAVCVRPALGEIAERLAGATGLPVHITGSGSAMFVLADDEAEAVAAAARLPDELARRCVLVEPNPW